MAEEARSSTLSVLAKPVLDQICTPCSNKLPRKLDLTAAECKMRKQHIWEAGRFRGSREVGRFWGSPVPVGPRGFRPVLSIQWDEMLSAADLSQAHSIIRADMPIE